jgi:hypothetical protein
MEVYKVTWQSDETLHSAQNVCCGIGGGFDQRSDVLIYADEANAFAAYFNFRWLLRVTHYLAARRIVTYYDISLVAADRSAVRSFTAKCRGIEYCKMKLLKDAALSPYPVAWQYLAVNLGVRWAFTAKIGHPKLANTSGKAAFLGPLALPS